MLKILYIEIKIKFCMENIKIEVFWEMETNMEKLKSAQEVLFQVLLLDDGKMYTEVCSVDTM